MICRRSIFWSLTNSSIARRRVRQHFSGAGSWRTSGSTSLLARILSAHIADACDTAGVKAHRWRNLRLHGRPAIFHAGGIAYVPTACFDVIGMTNLTEAKLAREAEICYATIAMITDYDCWHPHHDAVTLDEIIQNLNRNTSNVQRVMREVVRELPEARSCKCGSALSHAILTDRAVISAATKKRLAPIIGKYIS